MEHLLIYEGKVRNIYKLGEKYLLMKASDRVSSFDRHIGTIPGKGELLNKMSEFWFNKTKHIIDNHLIETQNEVALVHKCTPFKIEMVVRGYITGNTTTSLWTHYNNGSRLYSGNKLPEGLVKNQKLKTPIVTPTTKGKVDRPISKATIIAEGYMTQEECDYIYKKSLELFAFGQKIANNAGFILVDTKYEFGKTVDGKIILIDEVHTCDSSRYWLKESYKGRFEKYLEPEKLDKDCVRDWVKSKCNPYKDPIPILPPEIMLKAYNCYKYFYDTISLDRPESPTFNPQNLVVIIAGSNKDSCHVENLVNEMKKENILVETYTASAHKNTREVLLLIDRYNIDKRNIVWVTVAGRSNALSGVVAANSVYPVIACPPFSNKTDMIVNLHSTLQCPSNVPVMTVLEPGNVSLAIKRIFNLN
jgi:phosphoribosylaminoimidazole-succinocarboxamide synthase